MAAIIPPEGREVLFAVPARSDSAGTDEVTPPFAGTVVLSEIGLWGTMLDVVAVGDDDDEEDDSMMSDVVGGMELGTAPEEDNTSGLKGVAVEVETPTRLVEVGMLPMPGTATLAMTVGGTGGPVVERVGPAWPESSS
jgi:hypothetical protein